MQSQNHKYGNIYLRFPVAFEYRYDVLLDFWTVWCGPCRMVSPIIDEIAEERTDIKVGKVNVDDQMELARIFKVVNIPTLVVIKDGKVVAQQIGAVPKEKILELLA